LKKKGIPVISIFLTGRPLWVNPELNASDAFVVAWLPGTEGAAVADVLFRNAAGEINRDFNGKLSYSWPRSVDQTVLNRGDAKYDPLFAYGFGLTYAQDGALPQLPEAGAAAAEATNRTVYFEAGAVAPWRLYVGDDVENPALEVIGTRTATANSTRLVVQPVDRALQGDAIRARWDGSGTAWLFAQGPPPIDLSRESNGMLSLSFDVMVEAPPTAPVTLAMGCGEGCRGTVDMTQVLQKLPPKEWRTLNVKLRCFEAAGGQMQRITRPFELTTAGALDIRLANIRLTSAPEGETICPGSK
jgi:beta-glucosidase